MTRLLIVAIGGALGSAARYLLSGLVQHHTTPYFPTGTFAVNVLGCFAVGLAVGLASMSLVTPNARLFVVVGICGGFTTFSAFGYETLALVQDNEFWQAGVNAGGQLVLGLVAVWAGMALVRVIFNQ
jgi:CrcB protein